MQRHRAGATIDVLEFRTREDMIDRLIESSQLRTDFVTNFPHTQMVDTTALGPLDHQLG